MNLVNQCAARIREERDRQLEIVTADPHGYGVSAKSKRIARNLAAGIVRREFTLDVVRAALRQMEGSDERASEQNRIADVSDPRRATGDATLS